MRTPSDRACGVGLLLVPKRNYSWLGLPSPNPRETRDSPASTPLQLFTCLSPEGKCSLMNANADGYTLRGTRSAFEGPLAVRFPSLLEPLPRPDVAFFLPPTPPFPVFFFPLLRLLLPLALAEAPPFCEPERAVPTRGFFATPPPPLVCGNVCLPRLVVSEGCCCCLLYTSPSPRDS